MTDLVANQNYSIATGTNSTNPFITHFDVRDPTVNDLNYPVQKFWVNTVTDNLWILKGFTTTAGVVYAAWIDLTSGLTNTESLTGNTGGPVFVDASNNMNVVGDGVTVEIAGNPGTNTLTASTTGALASSYVTNSGTAIPSAGVLNVLGSHATTTSGSGNTITITTEAAVTTWTDQNVSFAAVSNHGYFIIGTLTATLPASPANGDTIEFFVNGSFVLTVLGNTGQTIQMATNVSSSAGTVVSSLSGDSLTLVYRSTDTKWCAISWIGAWSKT